MRLKEAFSAKTYNEEPKPFKTIQKQINQRRPMSHKSLQKAGKHFRKIGRVPKDIKERYEMPVPPIGKRVAK